LLQCDRRFLYQVLLAAEDARIDEESFLLIHREEVRSGVEIEALLEAL